MRYELTPIGTDRLTKDPSAVVAGAGAAMYRPKRWKRRFFVGSTAVSCETSSGQGATLYVSSSNSILRVHRVLRFSPMSCCLMAIFSGPLAAFMPCDNKILKTFLKLPFPHRTDKLT